MTTNTASPSLSATVDNTITLDTEIVVRRSVVDPSYKAKYAERALHGRKKKPTAADKRGCGDWLQRKLAELTLNSDLSLNVPALEAILDLNGVVHDHWNRTTPGWQGRLRMTGRLSLQRRVAEAEVLHTPTGDLYPPKAWVTITRR